MGSESGRRADLEIVRKLGRGGMGEVFLAVRREGDFKRAYALKRLRREFLESEAARSSFIDEARVAGLLYHPNVVRVFDVGTDEAGPFMLMELVDGLSLNNVIRRTLAAGTVIPLAVAIELMRDVALGLRAAHEATDVWGKPLNLIHRDISPDNILLGRDGVARLTDFGIAKAIGRNVETTQRLLKGKLSYMAPEVLRFEEPSVRSDIWSFGVVLFELLTQERLYEGDEGLRRAINEPPPDLMEQVPEAPPSLVGLMFTLLAKTPNARPASAFEVAKRLEQILAELTDELTPLAMDFATELFKTPT